MRIAFAQVLKEIAIVDAQACACMQRYGNVDLVFVRADWDTADRWVEIYPAAGVEEPINVDFFEPGCAALDPPK